MVGEHGDTDREVSRVLERVLFESTEGLRAGSKEKFSSNMIVMWWCDRDRDQMGCL